MKKVIVGLLLAVVLLVSTPVISAEKPVYLAVFGSSDLMGSFWNKYHPNLTMKTNEWEDIDAFLSVVRMNAGDKPVVLDIECHGSPETFMLYMQDKDAVGNADMCNAGWLMSKIDMYLGDLPDTVVILEACYSRCCVQRGIRSRYSYESDDIHIRDFRDKIRFPVYGIGNTVNFNQFVYSQYASGVRLRFEDLRSSIGKRYSKPLELSEEELTKMKYVYWVIYMFFVVEHTQ